MSRRQYGSAYDPSRDSGIRNPYRGRPAPDPRWVTGAEVSPRAGYSPSRESVRQTRPEEVYSGRRPDSFGVRGGVQRRSNSRSLAGLVCATAGLGLFCEGIAIAVAPQHYALGQVLFWFGIIVPFVILLRVLMVPHLGRLREITVVLLGLYPTLIFRMTSPLVLSGFDEHLHEQELLNLLWGSGLFAPNPILHVGPFYPGLELFTGSAIRLTGLPVILGMSLVVVLCRSLLVLLIYYGALLVSPSRRGASLVVAFYAVGPQFYEFNSQFAYQTLAVTLGLGGLVLLRRAQLTDGPAARPLFFAASLALVATVVTHHLTSWFVLAFLIAWAVMTPKPERKIVARATAVMGIAVGAWTAALAAPLFAYFGWVFSFVQQTARGFLGGGGGGPFGASGGTPPNSKWESLALIVYILACTAAALICAWIMLSRAFHNRDRMLWLLGVLDLMFPITGAAHFDPSIGSFGDRASTFFFFPLALSCSMIIMRDPRVARSSARRRNIFGPALLAALIGGTTVVYFGGTLLGSNPDWSRLPGSYEVSADPRTQDPETMAAVEWAAGHLPAGSTVVADRTPAVLLAGQARLWPVSTPENGFAPASLYFSGEWTSQDTAIVRALHIDYLYVDTRLAQSLPYLGYYIEAGETPGPTRITVTDVSKFAHVPGLRAVYHYGPVTIYNTHGLGVVSQRNGFQGYHSMGAGPLDAFFGVLVVLLMVPLRRRLAWVKPTVCNIGFLGTTLTVIAGTIFIGGALFALHLMPGPAFTVGVIAASVVVLAVQRRMERRRLIPRVPFPRRLDPLVLLGVIAGVGGLAIALHAAWITDVTDVNAILRAVS